MHFHSLYLSSNFHPTLYKHSTHFCENIVQFNIHIFIVLKFACKPWLIYTFISLNIMPMQECISYILHISLKAKRMFFF